MDTPPPLPSPSGSVRADELRSARRHGCLIGCLASVGIFLLVTVVLPFLVVGSVVREASREFSGSGAAGLFKGDRADEDADFSGDAAGLREVLVDSRAPATAPAEEKEEEGKTEKDTAPPASKDEDVVYKAVRIPLVGTIDLADDGFGEEGNAATALRSIRRATEDPSVDAILLLVDSGGGGITASDILYNALREFRLSDEGRRVVVLMGDMACSGAYYASLPADRILAHPTSITGSIGVILPSYNVRQLADRLGIADNSIQSGANKSMLNPMRDLTDEQRTMLQETVDELHSRFTSLVVLHRGLSAERVKALADGRIYTARQALQHKLVDDIGYLQDAEDAVVALLGNDHEVDFYEYEHKLSLRDLFATPSFWGSVLQHAVPAAAAPSPSGPQAR